MSNPYAYCKLCGQPFDMNILSGSHCFRCENDIDEARDLLEEMNDDPIAKYRDDELRAMRDKR